MHQRATRVRHATRERIEPLVELLFGFKSNSSSTTVKFNENLYLTLATNFGFYYQVGYKLKLRSCHLSTPRQDPVGRTGLMRHPIILQAIWAGFFYGKKAYGVEYQSLFQPIPPGVLAGVMTFVRNHLFLCSQSDNH